MMDKNWLVIIGVFVVCFCVILFYTMFTMFKLLRRKVLPAKASKKGDIVTITADIKENLAKIQVLVEKTQALTKALELQAAALIGQAEAPKKTRKPKAQKPGRRVASPETKPVVAEKKKGGRPKGSKNKATLAKEAAAQQTAANPGDDGDGPDKCANCGNPVLECVCSRVQGAMAAVDKH